MAGVGSPADFAKFIVEETEKKWAKVIICGHQAELTRRRDIPYLPFREWLVPVCVDDLIK